MQISRAVALVVLFSLALSARAAVEQKTSEDPSDADVTKFVRDVYPFANGEIGLVIGLIDEKGARVVGVARTDDLPLAKQLNGDTIFEIGSISKTFTTLLLQDMVDRGEMKLDDPVAKYLPDSVKVPSHGGKQITLLDLATQTSGLPFDVNNFVNPRSKTYFDGYSAERLYTFLSSYSLSSDPGATYSYSNVGMGLLGHAISRKAGADYETLLVDRICTPLKMDSTRIKLSPALKARMVPGHDASGAHTPNFDDLGVLVGAGAIRSCANDLLKYLAANAGIAPNKLTPTMQRTHVVRHHGSLGSLGQLQGDTAMAWMDEGQSAAFGSPLTGHGGGTGGYSTFIAFDQQHRRGVVVLTNQFGAKQRPASIGWVLLQKLPLTKASIEHVEVRSVNVVGIGVALEVDKAAKAVRIRSVYPASPAERAGLKPGQVFQKIGEQSAEGLSMEQCAALIRGAAGTSVRVVLIDRDQKVTDVQITRQKLQ